MFTKCSQNVHTNDATLMQFLGTISVAKGRDKPPGAVQSTKPDKRIGGRKT